VSYIYVVACENLKLLSAKKRCLELEISPEIEEQAGLSDYMVEKNEIGSGI
jgi:hypothetical protein